MRMSPQAMLVALNAVLVAGMAAVWLAGSSSWGEPAPVVPDPSSIAPRKVGAQAVAVTREALAGRPLFAQSRRPLPPAQSEAAAAPGGAFQDARLLGILGKGADGVAIVRVAGGNKRLRLGEELEGWALKEARGRTARFARGGGEVRELYLEHAAQQNGPPPPTAGAPPKAQAAAAAPPGQAPTAAAPPPIPAAGQKSIDELVAERRARREALLSGARAN